MTINDLEPTNEDVDYVLSHLPSSYLGPDGPPFNDFSRFKDLTAPIFLDICTHMLDGTAQLPQEFNYAFLICLPEGDGIRLADEAEYYEPSGTRHLSVVDAANRITANILLRPVERCVSDWISAALSGFLKGRLIQMLRNILDIDFIGQKISIKHRRGAIVLFDFRAAFPSMSHDLFWDTLLAIGLPLEYVDALKLFYKRNVHLIKVVGGSIFSQC